MEIRIRGLCKSYCGVPVLENVTLSAGAGITCVTAPSGGGKTTLLRILMGLEEIDSGAIEGLDGCRWAAVFQEDRLLEELDAMGNLRFALGPGLDRKSAEKMLAELGLERAGGKPVREFSGGMKRRLALVRALLAKSDALALDEPFAGLDRENRAKAAACIRRYADGKPVFLVTHDEEDTAELYSQIIPLR